MRAEHQDKALSEVTARVVGRVLREGHGEHVGEVIEDTLYHERTRLERDRYASESKDLGFWKDVGKQVVSASGPAQQQLLRTIVERFTREVMGHFDPRVYQLATKALPTGLGVLMNSLDPKRLLIDRDKHLRFDDNVLVLGESEAARRMATLGTLVVVPTHLSNMDSIVMGYAAYLMGLPPLTYGAGLNLFTNKLIGWFMNHLGAYRVDRRKKCDLYKEVLKEYATVTLELGYHNLFFPGGTRARSGGVERKLKKGLLGTAVAAYAGNLRAGRRKPNIYVVPCTISYGLVLEAETLIEDHLREVGKARYIIVDDEFSQVKRIAQFLRDLIKLDGRIYLTFGAPLDPFGNRVDFQGRSLDPRGRPVDITRYVCKDGHVVEDEQRDHEYTSELSTAIVGSFSDNNRLQSTHLAAFTAFQLMRWREPDGDVYRVLREGSGPIGFGRDEVATALAGVLAAARQKVAAGRLKLDPRMDGLAAGDVLDQALAAFECYHTRRALRRESDRIHVDDAELVYYYHNRATGYGLEAAARPGRAGEAAA